MRLGLHNPAISLMRMEQLVKDRDHLKRRKEENISDGSLNRDGDCDSKPQPDSGMDRQLSPMESTIFRSRKRLDLMTWLKLLKMYGAKEWLRHKLTGFFFGIPYNSLLMYVRRKCGNPLRLNVLKMKSTSENDNLNNWKQWVNTGSLG